MKRRTWLRCTVFLLVLGAVFLHLQGIFCGQDTRSYENIRRFRRERPGSLDAVYLGGSEVHTYWQPAFGWADRGIAVWNFTADGMPFDAVQNMMVEARKTQPDALYIVSLNTFKKDRDPDKLLPRLHRLADNIPLSPNKIRLVFKLCAGTDLDWLEFFAPIVRFHSRWDSLERWAFENPAYDHKASIHLPQFQEISMDMTGLFHPTEEAGILPEPIETAFASLLDYCERERVNVLFVTVPQCADEEQMARMNALEQLARKRGHACLDAIESRADYHLDLKRDLYNLFHGNVHGSLKFSDYLGAYLAEHYGFEDKRGRAGWESWDAAVRDYFGQIIPWTLPFEREHARRDDSLDAPVTSKPAVDGQNVTLAWKPVEGAQAYEIYRKTTGNWERLGETDGSATSWKDGKLAPKTKYAYAVVPFRDDGKGRIYGRFNHAGVSAVTGKQP